MAGDEQVLLLKQKHARLLSDYENLPVNYVSRRAEVSKSLEQVESDLSSALAEFKSSPVISAVQNQSLAEILLRGCLIILNLFFAHEFVRSTRRLAGAI